MKPVISIIIVVKNERGVADTLAGIAKQRKPAATEVIVVDASDTVSLTDIAAEYADVTWIPYKHPTGKAFTIPEQRNTGMRAAKGDIFVSIDAGCEADADWLQRLTAPIISGQEKLCAGSVAATDPNIFNSFERDPHVAPYLQEAPAGNLAMKREVVKTIGYFDESLTYGEDVDFTWRAIDAGYKIRLVPDAVIRHDFGTFTRRLKRTVRYGAARVPLYAKHRNRITHAFVHEPASVIYSVFLLGLPLTIVWPYYPLLLVPLFIKNIRRHPLSTIGNNIVFGVGVLRGLVRLAMHPQRNTKTK